MSGRGSVRPRSAQPAADELVRPPEPHREDTSELEEQRPGERRIAARERLVAFVVESADLAVRDRTHGRRARAGVEESDLADDGAGGHRYDARAGCAPFHRDHFERARDDDVDRSFHLTAADEDVPGAEALWPRVREDRPPGRLALAGHEQQLAGRLRSVALPVSP